MPVIYESWMDTRRLHAPDELSRRIVQEDVGVLVVEADFVFEEVFQDGGPLRFLGVCRSAVDHVDLESATRHGVAVVNTPGRNAQAVAELTMGLILSLARRIPQMDGYVKAGAWDNPVGPYVSMRGVELRGKTLGLVGLGAIGGAVSQAGRRIRNAGGGIRPLRGRPRGGHPGRPGRGALGVGRRVGPHLRRIPQRRAPLGRGAAAQE